ncbi:hypothetical protein CAEBREN_21479 [Caenorhabditis brenneri]|uniref:Uncharacterized protein n=1 Tax=Caenorhabditis brenneri TaxID=135651 RepID=G0N553_CAEBE|nr:hypothetical protein CAEBREN_21479 [Caenorhabditis brenneri]
MNWHFVGLVFFVVFATYNHYTDFQDPDQLVTLIQIAVVRIVFVQSVIYFAEMF